jgi:hypothetical protein
LVTAVKSKVKKRILLMVLCFLLILPFPAFATAIVALVGEDSITIAADSLGLGIPTETGETIRPTLCKILCIHHFCFAAAGVYVETNIDYNVWPVAKRELLRPGSLEEVAERFRTVIEPLVPRLAAVIEKKYPVRYAKLLEGNPMFQYLFAGFDPQGKPLTVRGEARINTKSHSVPISLSVTRGESSRITAVPLGSDEQIAAFLKGNPTWGDSAAADPFRFAESMIRLEIEASEKAGRREVGGPITIERMIREKHGVSLESIGSCRKH